MLTDAHCHPSDLSSFFPEFEEERRCLGVLAAASACMKSEYAQYYELSRNAVLNNSVPFFVCMGIHPQIFKIKNEQLTKNNEQRTMDKEQITINNEQFMEGYEKFDFCDLMETLELLASEKQIAAVGECGFDLFNNAFRETEALQERFFLPQIEIAIRHELPVVLHVRRAIHRIFSFSNLLAKCKAVVFHSWPGTFEEAEALLRKGINAYFSFGNTILLNHKQAIRSCALLPPDRLLTETDAPYQPRRGHFFSQWSDLPLILESASALRIEAGNKISINDLENQIEINFRKVFL